MESLQCRHCQTNFSGNFCPECGQKFIETPFSSKAVIGLLSETYDFGSKFFKTLFLLFVRPEKVTNTFLKGDLNRFVTPFKFLLSVVGLLFVFELLEIYVLGNEQNNTWYLPYFLALYFVLYLSVLNKIFFKNFNWLEHLLIAIYECSGSLLIFFLSGFTSDVLKFQSVMSKDSNSWAGYMFGVVLLYNLWFNAWVFGKNKFKTILKTLLIILVTIVIVFLVTLV